MKNDNWDGVRRKVEETFTKEMADTILAQLGGNRFIAMTGAKHFMFDAKASNLTFKIPTAKDGINLVKVTYNAGRDDYTMEFLSFRGVDVKSKGRVDSVYADQLQSIFTQYTGLHTSL